MGSVDFITLDKVVCCYPNYKEILKTSCQKARVGIGFSYPMDGVLAKAIQTIGAFYA